MNTCGTCRFFGSGTQSALEYRAKTIPKDFQLCGRIGQFDGYPDDPAPPGQKVFSVDGSGYFAALCVSTDFGCTEWEPKP